MNPTLITGGIIVLLVIYVIATYNGFVILKARIQEALSGIDIQLKRRMELIPNLVSTVKGYTKHEKTTLENLTKARTSLMKAGSLQKKAEANNMLSDALKSLFAVAENYPDLKASTNFQELQRQLEDTEDKIAYSRQFYNSNVLSYNTRVRMFPSSILANMFGFREFEFFEARESERKSVKVEF
jgi:LemA protein